MSHGLSCEHCDRQRPSVGWLGTSVFGIYGSVVPLARSIGEANRYASISVDARREQFPARGYRYVCGSVWCGHV